MSDRTVPEGPGLPASGRARPRWRVRFTPAGIAVAALTMLAAGVYATFELVRFHTLQSTSYDLTIFDQVVRSYAHFQPGISVLKGLHNGFGPHFSVLGDHWSPALASLAPLYWIYSGPQVLLVAESALFALAIPPIWLFTRRALGGGGRATAAAYLVSAAYALSWPIASALAFDFHEVAFAPVLIAVALERLQAGQVRTALLALGALLLVKEDMGLLVAGLGCYLAVSRPHLARQRLLGLGMIVAGIAVTVLATYVLIPALGGRANYYWAYWALGRNVPQLAGHLVAHPASFLHQLVTPRVKLDTMLWLAGTFCFLPLLSPISLAAIPLLLERMLSSTFPNWWVTSFHYNAYLVVILICAAVDGAVRLGRWADAAGAHWSGRYRRTAVKSAGVSAGAADVASLARVAAGQLATATAASVPAGAVPNTAASSAAGTDGRVPAGRPRVWRAATFWATATSRAAADRPARPPSRLSSNIALGAAEVMLVMAVLLVPRFEFGSALHADFYKLSGGERAAAAAAGVVPAGVLVAAPNKVGPQLSGRDTVLLWDGDRGTPPFAAPWVIANVSELQFTFNNIGEQRQRVAVLMRHTYKIVFQRDGYIVLHRSGLSAAHRRF